MDLKQYIHKLGKQAKAASSKLALLTSAEKNQLLNAMADGLIAAEAKILQANQEDLQRAKQAGIAEALTDRLALNSERIAAMADGFRTIVALDDPIGQTISEHTNASNLLIKKVRVPIGVIGIIYESRPNVTADVAAICLKTANAVILRGGSEALHTNEAIYSSLLAATQDSCLPEHAIQLIDIPDRDAVKHLVQMEEFVDLVIPRGGTGLIKAVVEQARVPILKHYQGLCHTYIDAAADLDMALKIAENAKCQRPSVCNAMETLLVHQSIAKEFLPRIDSVFAKYNVEVRGDETALQIMPNWHLAKSEDWDTEYLDYIISVKVVADLDQAIQHIGQHGSGHSEAIVTDDPAAQTKFTKQVDASAVFVNSSTRFNDGGEFGMGAEMGISTDKLHARGPVGLEELTTYKYIVLGNGQIRS